MQCKECGKGHDTDNEYFCPECEEKHQKRNAFRAVMNEIDKINKMDSVERNFLSGFSWAEKESFSLIFKRFIKANHFPDKDEEFVHEHAKKELNAIKETLFF
ncbi:MAG: hypothetical protein ACFFDF_22590 [Candidatus Odinarchaeota archaeon]